MMFAVLFVVVCCDTARLRNVSCDELRLARGALTLAASAQSAASTTHSIAYLSSQLVATPDASGDTLRLATKTGSAAADDGAVSITLKTLAFDAADDDVGARLFARRLAVERRMLGDELRNVTYFARLLAVNESCGEASGAVLEAAPLRVVDVARQMRQDARAAMCVALGVALQTVHLLEVLERAALVQCAWRTEALALTSAYELKLLDASSLASAPRGLPFGAARRCDDASSDDAGDACATHLGCLRDAGVGGDDVARPLEAQCVAGLCAGFDARSNVWGAGVAVFQPLFGTPAVARVVASLGADVRALGVVVDDMLEPSPIRRPSTAQLGAAVGPLYTRWREARECSVGARLPTRAALERRRDAALATLDARSRSVTCPPPPPPLPPPPPPPASARTAKTGKAKQQNDDGPLCPLSDGLVHVALGADMKMWRNIFTVFNSIILQMADPLRLRAHIILEPHEVERFTQWADCFVDAPYRALMLIHGVDLTRFTQIAKREDTHERLFVAHNFARFALPQLLPDVDKILWLDTDVILQADIAVLFDSMLCDVNYPNSALREKDAVHGVHVPPSSSVAAALVAAESPYIKGERITDTFNGVPAVAAGVVYRPPVWYGNVFDVRPTSPLLARVPQLKHCRVRPCFHFNAGVMGMRLDLWRKRDLTENQIEWMQFLDKHPSAAKGITQPPLILGFFEQVEQFAKAWNFGPAPTLLAMANGDDDAPQKQKLTDWFPKLIHFHGDPKPWVSNSTVYRRLWYRFIVAWYCTDEERDECSATCGVPIDGRQRPYRDRPLNREEVALIASQRRAAAGGPERATNDDDVDNNDNDNDNNDSFEDEVDDDEPTATTTATQTSKRPLRGRLHMRTTPVVTPRAPTTPPPTTPTGANIDDDVNDDAPPPTPNVARRSAPRTVSFKPANDDDYDDVDSEHALLSDNRLPIPRFVTNALVGALLMAVLAR